MHVASSVGEGWSHFICDKANPVALDQQSAITSPLLGLQTKIHKGKARKLAEGANPGGVGDTHALALGEEVIKEGEENAPGQRPGHALQHRPQRATAARQQPQLLHIDLLVVHKSLHRIQILHAQKLLSKTPLHHL